MPVQLRIDSKQVQFAVLPAWPDESRPGEKTLSDWRNQRQSWCDHAGLKTPHASGFSL